MPDTRTAEPLSAEERVIAQMRREHSHHTLGFSCAGCGALLALAREAPAKEAAPDLPPLSLNEETARIREASQEAADTSGLRTAALAAASTLAAVADGLDARGDADHSAMRLAIGSLRRHAAELEYVALSQQPTPATGTEGLDALAPAPSPAERPESTEATRHAR